MSLYRPIPHPNHDWPLPVLVCVMAVLVGLLVGAWIVRAEGRRTP